LADYTRGEYKKKSRLLIQSVEADIPKAIDTTQDLAACKQQQIQRLQDDYFLVEAMAAEVVDMLVFVLGASPIIPTRQNTPADPYDSVDNNTILKQGNLVALKKNWLNALRPFFEKGILTLYRDRLEWRGKNNFDLPITKIASLAFVRFNLNKSLEIRDGANNKYQLYGFDLKSDAAILHAYEALAKIVFKNNIPELESWHLAIEKQRSLLY
jgi:hypothetical protein